MQKGRGRRNVKRRDIEFIKVQGDNRSCTRRGPRRLKKLGRPSESSRDGDATRTTDRMKGRGS